MNEINIPDDHPRADSLRLREKIVRGYRSGAVALAGLIAYGRGEAFDYLIGERTTASALHAIDVSAAILLRAKRPVISVNGNVAALVPDEVVQLSAAVGAAIEINLFYRSEKREIAIEKILRRAGATRILGIGGNSHATIPELHSERRRVDPEGILAADVVLVPLEDGDRTEAIVKMGKKVVAIDLNPLSRTSRLATVTIVDNIVRAFPRLIDRVNKMKTLDAKILDSMITEYDNSKTLGDSIRLIESYLTQQVDASLYKGK